MPIAERERPSLLQLQFNECYRYIAKLIYIFNILCMDIPHFIFKANWIKVHGITYKKLCTLCVGVDNHDLPIFAQLVDVYIVEQHKPFAYARIYTASQFNTHYHAFEVTPTTEFKLIALEYQEHPFPLHMRRLPSGTLAVHSCQVLKDGNRDSKFSRADITSHAPSRDHAR